MRTKILSVALVAGIASGCGPNQRIIESGRENPPLDVPNANIPPSATTFESDLEAMRTADFYFIHVFRRRDGQPLDPEDKAFMSANIPQEINRRRVSDNGRALITGSNFRIPENLFSALKERFAFEDHSKPESELPKSQSIANANSAR
jgi:hypothetical protein